MTARMYYDNDVDPSRARGAVRRRDRLRQPGACPRAQPARFRRGRDRRAGRRLQEPGARGGGRSCGSTRVADAVRAADVVMILVPDTAQKAVYDAEIAPNLKPGTLLMFAHGFNIRFGRIKPGPGIDVGMVAPEGPGPPAAQRVLGRRRRPRALRRRAGQHRHRSGADPCLRPRDRGDARRRARDDVQGGDRDRPVRRAGAAVRRRLGAHQGRVRDARRGRLPAGARLLRDDARAEADRRPDVPGRPQLHALQRQRHGRVRRLRLRAARRRGRQGDDEGRPRRHPERRLRQPLDRRPGGRRRRVPGAPRARSQPPDRAGRRGAAGADAVPRSRSSSTPGEAQAMVSGAASASAGDGQAATRTQPTPIRAPA